MNKKFLFFAIILLTAATAFASDVFFEGGYSKVSLQDNNHMVTLTEGARVRTEDFQITADTIELYGKDYRFVRCSGNVEAYESKTGITLKCASIVYDRETSILTSDGWITIDDPEDDAILSGSWLEYNSETSIMKLQMKAKIVKDTDNGLLTCTSDSMEFNLDLMTLALKGASNVIWGDDSYKANIIMVDVDKEEIVLYDTISGEING